MYTYKYSNTEYEMQRMKLSENYKWLAPPMDSPLYFDIKFSCRHTSAENVRENINI